MLSQFVRILDSEHNVAATAHVVKEGETYSGSVNLDRMPHPLRLLFERYETIVNDQVFSLLDQIEEQIGAVPFVAVFEDGSEAKIADLQIFPTAGVCSFIVTPAVEQSLDSRALLGSRQRFEAVLSKVPDVVPDPQDHV